VVALEATVSAGEVLFVPAGWWHCCLNLEPSVAVTQNYAPRSCARSILAYLKRGEQAGELVSGLPPHLRPHLAEEFADVLRRLYPEALNDDGGDGGNAAAAASAPAADEGRAPPAKALVEREATAEFRFAFG
jgi:hypothetical protein